MPNPEPRLPVIQLAQLHMSRSRISSLAPADALSELIVANASDVVRAARNIHTPSQWQVLFEGLEESAHEALGNKDGVDALVGRKRLEITLISVLLAGSVGRGPKLRSVARDIKRAPQAAIDLWNAVTVWLWLNEAREAIRFHDLSGMPPVTVLPFDFADEMITQLDQHPLVFPLLMDVRPDSCKIENRFRPDLEQVIQGYSRKLQSFCEQAFGIQPIYHQVFVKAASIGELPGAKKFRLWPATKFQLAREIKGIIETHEKRKLTRGESRNVSRFLKILNRFWFRESLRICRMVHANGYYPTIRWMPFLAPCIIRGAQTMVSLASVTQILWRDFLVNTLRIPPTKKKWSQTQKAFINSVVNDLAHALAPLQAQFVFPNLGITGPGKFTYSDGVILINASGKLLDVDTGEQGPFGSGGEMDLVVVNKPSKTILVAECKRFLPASQVSDFQRVFRKFYQLRSGKTGDEAAFEELRRKVAWFDHVKPRMKLPGETTPLSDWTVRGAIITDIFPQALWVSSSHHNAVFIVGSFGAREFLEAKTPNLGLTVGDFGKLNFVKTQAVQPSEPMPVAVVGSCRGS